jgi:hypothetical protein
MKERAVARSLYIIGGRPPTRKLWHQNSSMDGPGHDAVRAVTAYLQGAGTRFRTVAEGEFGVVVDDVGGRPLEVGVRVSGGLVRAQAWVAPAGSADPWVLLHRNRLGELVRYATSSAGDVFVHGEVPARGVDEAVLDRLLGLLVEAAAVVRGGGGAGGVAPGAGSGPIEGAEGAARRSTAAKVHRGRPPCR